MEPRDVLSARLLRILSRCTLEHAEDICRVSARDSGKTLTDAAFGEVYVSLEKLAWLCDEGEAARSELARLPIRIPVTARTRCGGQVVTGGPWAVVRGHGP